ncbi:amino acid ABC transporter permease [Jatrophihabitans telluris]|uniref:Amino acid ABC transporter permease n=1 Tax=Jatrophihabitans telluris TaxID=2038343 RepID=A0ABY4QWZ7_9ACTN|nr:amino acid ABC transporter permease [Jatrophihabitans telluris]UQX87697.1 amino acid ABC transporter permease [Jatrophihabitans telluris]
MTTTTTAAGTNADDPIKAVPLRRPGRLVVAVILIVLLALFVYGAATNSAYEWHTFFQYLFDQRISQAALVTLELTVISMAIAIALGIVLAVMRMSDNPVLKSVAWLYLWIFRGTPIYVQLVFWGLITTIYKQIDLGVPFMVQFTHLKTGSWLTPFVMAFLGLGLNEAAYMAEIVRAGIGSVDEGQHEAAIALAMTWGRTMWRVVLPQAMRVIIPPTGNEVISMLKTTSLVVGVPLTTDLYSVSRQIGGVLYRPIPLLLVASAWYLAVTSVLMVGQYYLERYFARGASRKLTSKQLQALADAQDLGANHLGGTH